MRTRAASFTSLALVLLLLVVVAACGGADVASFQPTEDLRATGEQGQPAAAYEVRAANDRLAVVQVWSRGARVAEDGRTLVSLVAEVQNVGDRPVRLAQEQVRLEAFTRSGAPLPTDLAGVTATAPGGSLAVQAGEVGKVRLDFALRSAVKPDDLGGLRLRWGLAYDDGRGYLQFTEFRRAEPRTYASGVYYDPIFGLYDPFVYGPPYGFRHYFRHRVPVGRVIVVDRDQPRVRDHR
jgi:hypothetical protein